MTPASVYDGIELRNAVSVIPQLFYEQIAQFSYF